MITPKESTDDQLARSVRGLLADHELLYMESENRMKTKNWMSIQEVCQFFSVPCNRRRDIATEIAVKAGCAIADTGSIRAGADHMRSRGVPLHVALRTLTRHVRRA
jgi:poly(A) polymerase Pap1